MDFDYEHLWTKADRPGFLSMMTQLATAFHQHGWEISMALGAFETDSGNNAYDYQTLAANLDELHPDVLRLSLSGRQPHGADRAARLGGRYAEARAGDRLRGKKFMLGLPNYAIGLGWYDWLKTGMALCIASAIERRPTRC